MRIPHPRARLHAKRLSHIPLDDDSTGRRSDSRKHDVCDFRHLLRLFPFLANSNNDLWFQLVLERLSFASDHRPSFTNEASPTWDGKRGWNDVKTCIQEYDLAWWKLRKGRSEMKKQNTVSTEILTLSKTAWSASVSSVTPSPFAPKSLTLMKSSTSWSAYCGWVFPTILPCESNNIADFNGASTFPWVNCASPLFPV